MDKVLSQATKARREAVMDDLAAASLFDAGARARAEQISARNGQPVEQVLNQLGALTDDELAKAYARVAGCALWNPLDAPPQLDPEALGLSIDYLRRSRILPLARDGDVLVCAACDPLDDQGLAGVAFAAGGQVRVLAARARDWAAAFDAVARHEPGALAPDESRLERDLDQVSRLGDEGAGARLVAQAFEAAIAVGASDIHFEPRRNDFHVRLRIDGELVDHKVVSADLAARAVSRIKVVANLNLGEKRLPQDGRTTFVIGGRQIDVRVATSPTVFGESAVLRILDRTHVPLDLGALGFSDEVAATLKAAAGSPHGLFLVSGPTGSGKTTTLYALLQTFAGKTRKVLSVEDPVEFHFEHVSQTQVAPQVGLTFAAALRSFLRQDPDVILVGEIRDPETAAVAMQAAMTGHFVLASVHANDALAVVPRLIDLGVEPYQLAAGLRGAAAQRLVRRLCLECREAHAPEEDELGVLAALSIPAPERLFRARGCAACNHQGFQGRLAIGEAFMADAAFLRALAESEPAEALAAHGARAGLIPMLSDGARKAALGLTTLGEVMAAIQD